MIREHLLTVNPYSRVGAKMGKITAIVLHYYGAPGQTAAQVRAYFESLKDQSAAPVYASAHYLIDPTEVVTVVPENEIAYHAGPHSKATPWALAYFNSEQANHHSIGIEMAHPDATGRIALSVLAQARLLCASRCIRYGLDPMVNIVTHNQITGKDCPRWMVAHPEDLTKFRLIVKATIASVLEQ